MYLVPPAVPLTARDADRAKRAMTEARSRWPGVIGEVIAEEIAYGHVLLASIGPNARTARLIDAVLDTEEMTHGPRP